MNKQEFGARPTFWPTLLFRIFCTLLRVFTQGQFVCFVISFCVSFCVFLLSVFSFVVINSASDCLETLLRNNVT